MPLDRSVSSAKVVMPSLEALLASIVDYAGLFPPARLPLDAAIRNFARYRQEPDAWMLARFVIPAGRLEDLTPYAELFEVDPPFTFSLLGTGGADAPAFLRAVDDDARAILRFHERFPGQVRVDAMETRLPEALLTASPDSIHRFLCDLTERFTSTGLPDLELFFEVPLDDRVQTVVPAVLEAMVAFNETGPQRVGLKIRTGGLEPEAFPPAGRVAFAVTACRDAGVPFKATAGLHHPLHHYDEQIGTPMHGFFNLFGAAVLASVHELDPEIVRAVLLDEEADHFRFTAEGFSWQQYGADVEAIRHARRTLAISFGSCSFDEPREDLQALGLL